MASDSELVSTEFPAVASGNLFPRRSTLGIKAITQRWPTYGVATAAGFYCEARSPNGWLSVLRKKTLGLIELCAACNIRHLSRGCTPGKVIARFKYSTKCEAMERNGSCRPVWFSEVNDRTPPLHRRETQDCETNHRDLSRTHDVR